MLTRVNKEKMWVVWFVL